MDTFSVNSLKILERSLEEFENKYIFHLDFINKNEAAQKGERLHALISYYIKGFEIEKMVNSLEDGEKKLFLNLINSSLFGKKENFIKSEESFLVKVIENNLNFYLTGRFDAVYKDNEKIIIYDWKSKNIPQEPQEDLQSIVYLYCGAKIFNTKNISLKYISLFDHSSSEVCYKDDNTYRTRILDIIKKLPIKYLT